jgi:poly-gamma-glutamate synthesis protein (capsule biosynthesis protein)
MELSNPHYMNDDNSILFLGDVVPYKPFKFKNDLRTVINLECPITKNGTPVTGKVNLSVPENHLGEIFGHNLFAVNLANNHILDYGPDGLESTIDELSRDGVSYFGINRQGDDGHNPLITTYQGINVALISVVSESTSPVTEFDDFNYLTLLDNGEVAEKIQGVREKVERVIVYIHWGEPDSSLPLRKDIITARELIDSGADIIIGSHAHAPQPVEKYKNGIIAYNLGNFIMPSFKNTPSYYDENGDSLSSFSKKLMLWNRVSWGLEINLKTMDYRIRKFIFIADRIFEMKTTPFDKFMELHPANSDESYDSIFNSHLKRRILRRKFRDFINNPAV